MVLNTSNGRSRQDQSLIATHINKIKDDYDLRDESNAFYFFALSNILNLQDDEILDSITDQHFILSTGGNGGHDRGIDAVYIDENTTVPTIHLFNFKYVLNFEDTGNFFPSNEIDKIAGFMTSLMGKGEKIKSEVNPALYAKIEEIWAILGVQNPNFVFHICANMYPGFEKSEKSRFERMINNYSNFTIQYDLMGKLVELVTSRGKQVVNANIKAIDKQYFEKSDGNIRALIVNVDARDLLRIVSADEEVRGKADMQDFSVLQDLEILEDAFEQNVRVYLRQRSRINRSIKQTAISDDDYKIFYYNNGITITCGRFRYPCNVRSPIIELEDLQVVNGGQTIHALYEALKEDINHVANIEVLCRIYETQSTELSTNIAEFTNSQNPVTRRDVRSIDPVQQKLEQEFLVQGLYYERKRNQHVDKPKDCRIDAEKVGQVLMAAYNKFPAEAKNKKSQIFGTKYDEVFDDSVCADKILFAERLFRKIEENKIALKNAWLKDPTSFEKNLFLLHASYYVLYIIARVCEELDVQLINENVDKAFCFYTLAVQILREVTQNEIEELGEYKDNYTDAAFFKSNKAKMHIERLLTSEQAFMKKASAILEAMEIASTGGPN